MIQFEEALLDEVRKNLANLRRDLEQIVNPELANDQFAEGYFIEQYELFLSSKPQFSDQIEILSSFYRSIEVLQQGHPNLITAEVEDLTRAYQTLLESAILFGEELLEPGT